MQGPPAASNASLQRQSAGTCFEGVSQGVFQGVSPSVKGSVPIAHSNASHRPPRQHDLLFISTIITPSSSLPFCSLLFSLSLVLRSSGRIKRRPGSISSVNNIRRYSTTLLGSVSILALLCGFVSAFAAGSFGIRGIRSKKKPNDRDNKADIVGTRNKDTRR